ncbi:MAG: hypothetical protein AUI14_00440 [Actinobacteria bacterium 13_2_20CM_2_71_6]|nr:MAG: hypothetical protein AUI14_00440 [Actinobacteria bacterium 13_2_20CM_2_71_6]
MPENTFTDTEMEPVIGREPSPYDAMVAFDELTGGPGAGQPPSPYDRATVAPAQHGVGTTTPHRPSPYDRMIAVRAERLTTP